MNKMDVALICKALSDSNRLEIVQMLSESEKCGCKLLERFEITQPTLSHHMKTFRKQTMCKHKSSSKKGPCHQRTLRLLRHKISNLCNSDQ